MTCEVCGCTDERACFDPETELPCYWAEPNLCSVCARMRGPLKRMVAALGRVARWQFFPPAGRHILSAIYAQIAEDGMGDSSAGEERWYCGDPSCPVCLEDDRVPREPREIRRQ